jgi:hypothetical protein
MIASPSDVASERNIIREVLSEWNIVNADTRKMVLLPVGWETHTSPAMGDRPQAIINKQILKDCDLLVGVFWTRIGTSTGDYISGTVEEIEEHIKAGKPVMLYFSSAPVHPDSVDTEQYTELKKFRESCKSRGVFETYNDLNDFKSKFYRQLQLKVNQDSYFIKENQAPAVGGNISETVLADIPSLSREAQTLLKEASQDATGMILCLRTLGGFHIQTNGKDFVGDNNPRNRAIWEGALGELERHALVSDAGHKREVFQLTRRGYEIAEIINP